MEETRNDHQAMSATLQSPWLRTIVIAGSVAVVGCAAPEAGPRHSAGECQVDDQATTQEQAIQRIAPGPVEFFLEEDSGGPLRCQPTREGCEEVLRECAGAAVAVEVGLFTELAVGISNLGPVTINVVETTISGDAAFALLAPLPSRVTPAEQTFISVGVTPTEVGTITATVHVVTDADNSPVEGVDVVLVVEGTAAP